MAAYKTQDLIDLLKSAFRKADTSNSFALSAEIFSEKIGSQYIPDLIRSIKQKIEDHGVFSNELITKNNTCIDQIVSFIGVPDFDVFIEARNSANENLKRTK